jgi:hypothetical protein
MKFTLRSLFVLLLVCVSGAAFAISRIEGTLTDMSGTPIINAVVTVTQGGLAIGSGLTDFDGKYTVAPVPAGTYDVTFAYLNFKDVVSGVQVGTDQIQTVNNKMSISNTATKTETIVTAKRFEKPLIDFKSPPHGMKTAEEIEKAPTTNLSDIASLTTQAYQSRNGAGVSLGGGRLSNTTYIVDGVQLPAGSASFTNQAQGSVDQISTYSSGIPARYGDATGGIITITTKGITPKLRGGIRLQHSIDGYNSNLASFNLAGPLIRKRFDSVSGGRKPLLGFTLDGQADYNQDDNPTYNKNYVLNAQKQAEIEANPLTRLPSANGTPATYYATESIKASDLEEQKKRPNAEFYRGQLSGKLIFPLSDRINVVAGASGFASDAANYDQEYTLFSSDAQSRRRAYTGRGFVRFTQKFASGSSDSNRNGAISNAYYTVQADYQKDYVTNQDKNHKHNTFNYGYVGKFEQLLDSVFVPGYDDSLGFGVRLLGYRPRGIRFTRSEINPLLANYTSNYFNITPAQPVALSEIEAGRGLRNGDLPTNTYSLWRNVGAGNTGWSKRNNDQIAVTVDAAFDYNYKRTRHSIEVGLYYQQRNERFYSVNGASLWGLMRLLSNNVVNPSEVNTAEGYVIKNGVRYTRAEIEAQGITVGPNDTILYDRLVNAEGQSQFDRSLRKKLNKGATDYINIDEYDPSFFSMDMFAPDDLHTNGQLRANYYGYDWMGNRETGNINFNDFWEKKDPSGAFYTRPIAAYRPNYIAGYLSDYIQFKDFLITLGVRVERFDANTKVLRDPYSLLPVYTAANLAPGTVRPSNIGSDYVVYVGENVSANPSVIGYRNGDTWYDAQGKEVANPVTLRTSTGAANLVPWLQKTDNRLVGIRDSGYQADQAFTDYKPQVNVMPRINFSFPLNEKALFYAHYDVLVQRPNSAYNIATPLDYYYLQDNATGIIGNPDLKPEKMIDYQVGFQQQLSANSSVSLQAFYKQRKDQIAIRSYYLAYPTTYYTYGNRDFSTTKGFALSYDLRRLGKTPISMLVNYTLSFNEGTGSDANSANGGSGGVISGSSLLANYIGAGLPNARNQFPLTIDSRHNINATIDYRYRDAEGPTIGGVHFLENAGASLIFRTRSGEPYTKYISPLRRGERGGVVAGGVNASRLPWHYMFDLNIDKDFMIRFGKQDGEKVTMRDRRRQGGLAFNVFIYAQNLLNTRDVLNVYGYTGTPGDDGYLTSGGGSNFANQQQDPQSYRDLYQLRTQDINYLNNPRTIVLGLKVNF